VSAGGAEDDPQPAPELGEDRHADSPDEHVDRLRERPVARPSRSPESTTARTCSVNGTGKIGTAIWAASAVTAAIRATLVIADALKLLLSSSF
jgi:hypothetical protein